MNSTVILYVSIYLLTTLFAIKSQARSSVGQVYFKWRWLVASFMIHWVFLCFTNISVDYKNYMRIILNVSFENLFLDSEIAFNGLCLILKCLFKSPDIVIFFIKSITLLIFYKCFIMLRNNVSLGLSVLAYNLLLYLQGFLILGMQLAIALLFLSIIYIERGDIKRSLFLLIVACSVHSSTILFVPIFILYLIINSRKHKMRGNFICVLSVSYVIIYIFMGKLLNWAINTIPQFSQYKIYHMIDKYSGLGIMQIVFFIPIFYFIFLLYRNDIDNSIKNLAIICSITAFLFAMLGYKIEVFSRINTNFIMIYSFFIPVLFFERKYKCQVNHRYIFNYRSDLMIWIVYILIRGLDVFINMGLTTSSAMINPYVFYWPF